MDKSQLMKGILEGCILKIIEQRETYGYEIVTNLQENGFADVREGTLYPLLLRLEKKELITATYKPSPLGPSRKYYTLTPQGTAYLQEFQTEFQEICTSVKRIFKEGDYESTAQ
ncbi:MAG: PadR family transcriptional regulator [Eubacteriales bacterium]|nr:PadR family transcriptional regulator [Eubacteriales bacterium]